MNKIFTIVGVLILGTGASAGETNKLKEPPPYKLYRAAEDYRYLAGEEAAQYEDDWMDPVKYVPLDDNRNVYLTLGGEFRPRFEYFRNRGWNASEDEDFYSQRVSAHVSLQLGESVRVFTELYHGYKGGGEEIAEFDELDWHQGFVEVLLEMPGDRQLTLRAGRQEMAFGAARLVGIREGPNIRRAFDAVRSIYQSGNTTLNAFYGREVLPEFRVFDNDFVLFDDDSQNPELWGFYSQFSIPGDVGPTEAYYFGFQVNSARFNDVVGKERRHTIGIRRLGMIGKHWHYNTELIYQFGNISGQDIRAFNLESDWHYEFINTPWQPSIGMKLELTSGDNRAGDGEINRFNPMFENPEYYSLAKTITPVNMRSVHPSLTLRPNEKLNFYIEWAWFWRESDGDGLYSPPRFLARDGVGVSGSKIGQQLGIKIEYEISRHLVFDLDISYFMAEDFLEATGQAENILHIAPTLSFKF